MLIKIIISSLKSCGNLIYTYTYSIMQLTYEHPLVVYNMGLLKHFVPWVYIFSEVLKHF